MVEFPSKDWKDYELLDSGCGEKLERFGQIITVRPEPKALWDRSMTEAEWRRLADEQWYIRYGAHAANSGATGSAGMAGAGSAGVGSAGPQFRLRLGLTAFKHVGIFPEQAPNWEFIYSQVQRVAEAKRKLMRPDGDAGGAATDTRPKVLNLFAYTGGASLAAKAAGADVTHLDSIKQVVTWARGNMEASGLDDIRWIVEDAMKFVQREERRGNLYDGIILDPPAYGHGPNGEKWKLDDSLFGLLRSVSHILKPQNSFMVLNLYSNGYSAALGETLVRQAFGRDFAGPGTPCETRPSPLPVAEGQIAGRAMQEPGVLTSGELALNDRFGKALPLSIYVRLSL